MTQRGSARREAGLQLRAIFLREKVGQKISGVEGEADVLTRLVLSLSTCRLQTRSSLGKDLVAGS
jgi:hypothetical protein